MAQLWSAFTHLSAAAIGAAAIWFVKVRKLTVEIEKCKAETAELEHRRDIREAVLILRNRAVVLLQHSNTATMSKASWASLLPNPNLVAEALIAVGAERVPGKGDWWTINLTSVPQVPQFKNAFSA